MNLPLSFSPVAITSSTEETEALFHEQFVSSRIMKAKHDGEFGVAMNGVQIGGCVLSSLHHNSDYEVDCGEVDDDGSIIFGYGYGAASSTLFNGQEFNVNDHGVVITQHSNVRHKRKRDSYELVVSSSSHAAVARLQSILDRHTSRRLTFNEVVPLNGPTGAHARSTLSYIINSIDSNPAILDNPVVMTNFEELILGIILSLPNNYSQELNSPDNHSAVPGVVTRAEAFIADNAHLPISLADVLTQAGCGRNSLFKNFRKFRGYTPWEFLTERRLTLARQRLLDASEVDTVTSIAIELGFTHMGRFSMTYRRRYGEKPSNTLGRVLD